MESLVPREWSSDVQREELILVCLPTMNVHLKGLSPDCDYHKTEIAHLMQTEAF